jgi:hypothetical protein
VKEGAAMKFNLAEGIQNTGRLLAAEGWQAYPDTVKPEINRTPHYGAKQAEKDRKRFLAAQEKANAKRN